MEPIKPTVQVSLKDVSIDEGKTVQLDCVIMGQPVPKVVWYHNEEPIKESADVALLVEGDKSSLNIHKALLDHAGNYKVVAINTAGEASSNCVVKVTPFAESGTDTIAKSECRKGERKTEDLSNTFKEEVNIKEVVAEDVVKEEEWVEDDYQETDCLEYEEMFHNQTAQVGETVKFEAVIIAEPAVWVEWYFNGKNVTTRNDKFVISSAGNRYTLTIRKMTSVTVGKVEIVARNRVGVSSVEAFLGLSTSEQEDKNEEGTNHAAKVLEVGEVVTKEGKVVEEESPEGECLEYEVMFDNKTAEAGETVKFEAVINAEPYVWVLWYFNDEMVKTSNDDFEISSTGNHYTLTIKKMSADTIGEVKICASNSVGVATVKAFLTLSTPEDNSASTSPKNDRAQPQVESSVTIEPISEQSRSQTSEVVDPSTNGGIV